MIGCAGSKGIIQRIPDHLEFSFVVVIHRGGELIHHFIAVILDESDQLACGIVFVDGIIAGKKILKAIQLSLCRVGIGIRFDLAVATFLIPHFLHIVKLIVDIAYRKSVAVMDFVQLSVMGVVLIACQLRFAHRYRIGIPEDIVGEIIGGTAGGDAL